ncbi:uncharacterized protein LOC121399206 [Xenopus laevis]|uniref:Uncharacterized protein LOC121399206 n=1 Tax=Xenopus laevis TaxID=8355 RepID=A0A8J1M1M8_XENLA|nr:uncharacterized protein LOC121399206 [Xenopus laevis]
MKVIDGRFSIEDNMTSFSITMAGMKPQDSDIYQCGIEFTGNDAMHPITVTVLPGVCRETAPWVEMVDFPENFIFVKEKDLVTVSCRKQFVEKTFRLECRQVSHEFQLFSRSEETTCVEKCKKVDQWDPDLTFNPDEEYYGPDELVELSCPAGYKPNDSIIQCIRDKNTSSWNVTQVSCEPLGPSQSKAQTAGGTAVYYQHGKG